MSPGLTSLQGLILFLLAFLPVGNIIDSSRRKLGKVSWSWLAAAIVYALFMISVIGPPPVVLSWAGTGYYAGQWAGVWLVFYAFFTVTIDRKAKRRIGRIQELFLNGDYSSTITALTPLLQSRVEDPAAWILAGRACTELSDYSRAEDCYKEVLKHDPENVDALLNLGILYRLKGEYDGAMTQYEKAVCLTPNNADIYSSMCVVEIFRKRFDKAREYGMRAYTLNSHDATIAMNLALACHFSGDPVNRDRLAAVAEALGYPNTARVQRIISGEESLW